MLYHKSSGRMTKERFERWFDEFKQPYTQTKFIHSYKALENNYSELIIRYRLSYWQRNKVKKFLHKLPKMNHRRFRHFLHRFLSDTSILYRYSPKDFTAAQLLTIRFYLLKNHITNYFTTR